MITRAISAMARVKSVGEKYAKQVKIQEALVILDLVFAFIPLLNELGPDLGITEGFFNIIAEVGNVALVIQGITADPYSALMYMMGLFFRSWDKERG